MADVLLTVGVNPNLDFSQFEKDLNAIFAKYEKGNKHTINLGFAMDKGAQSSLQNVDNILNGIQAEAKTTVSAIRELTAALQGAGTGGVKKVSKEVEQFRKHSKAIDDYFSMLKKLNSLNTDVHKGDDDLYASKSGKWSNLAAELNKAADAYNKVGEAIKSLPSPFGDRLEQHNNEAQSKYNAWFEETSNKASEIEERKLATKQEELNRLNKQAAVLQDRINRSLTDYTAGKSSRNAGSKSAYDDMRTQLKYIQELRSRLGGISGDMDVDFGSLKDGLAQIDSNLREDTSTLKANGDARKSWSQGFQDTISRLSTYFTASQMLMTAIRSMKAMVREAVSVEDAMVQMQIVTKSNSTEMAKFASVASRIAKQTASSITDIVDSATVYARLGYDSTASTTLAKYTAMISKVGNINVADVQSAVTAIVKAFTVDVNDVVQVEAVFDKLIETGNNLPISVAELAEGMNNAGSALAASGATYEQSLAMLAASNATVQNISKSSTGLRTIVARIRNTKAELDELGESMTEVEYDKIVKALTDYKVSMTDASGDIRNPYEILKDIAAVAKDLDPNDYAALAKTLAGTRIQNVFYSLVDNFSEAEKAMSLMGESAGALDSAFATYGDSISAHIQKFKTQFQDLSSAVIGSGVANNIIDLGTGFLNLATSITRAGAAIPTLIAGFAALKGAKSIF